MAQFMKNYTDQTYALLRIVTGFLFLFHGTQKLFGFPEAAMEGAMSVAGITGATLRDAPCLLRPRK